jgi:hypothetical protein
MPPADKPEATPRRMLSDVDLEGSVELVLQDGTFQWGTLQGHTVCQIPSRSGGDALCAEQGTTLGRDGLGRAGMGRALWGAFLFILVKFKQAITEDTSAARAPIFPQKCIASSSSNWPDTFNHESTTTPPFVQGIF